MKYVIAVGSFVYPSRPPHGGRGLKFCLVGGLKLEAAVALPTEGVD